MNKTYKDSKQIKEIIDTIVSVDNMYKWTGESDLRNQLEAVAEVSFNNGQFTRNQEILSLKYELDFANTENQKLKKEIEEYHILSNSEEIEWGIQKIKDGYNELQAFLGSPNRIK